MRTPTPAPGPRRRRGLAEAAQRPPAPGRAARRPRRRRGARPRRRCCLNRVLSATRLPTADLTGTGGDRAVTARRAPAAPGGPAGLHHRAQTRILRRRRCEAPERCRGRPIPAPVDPASVPAAPATCQVASGERGGAAPTDPLPSLPARPPARRHPGRQSRTRPPTPRRPHGAGRQPPGRAPSEPSAAPGRGDDYRSAVPTNITDTQPGTGPMSFPPRAPTPPRSRAGVGQPVLRRRARVGSPDIFAGLFDESTAMTSPSPRRCRARASDLRVRSLSARPPWAPRTRPAAGDDGRRRRTAGHPGDGGG